MVGSQIGDYRIVDKLGEGGMGVVFKAVDVRLDRPVAIKMLPAELASNPELVQRFQAEARAQANLSHTNLATLYAFIVDQGNAYMVMEYVEGENFDQIIKRNGPINPAYAVPWFKQALMGVGAAHRVGIIHRDIKPSNLMLNRQGIVKVMDFGIAKALGTRGMTRTGTQLGTLPYMSPEQIQNRPVDVRSDIYSLGITLYEMLSGHTPFEGDNDFQMMQDHVNTPPPPLTRYFPYAPRELENVVAKALAKNPDERYQTVEEFGVALEHPESIPAPGSPGYAQPPAGAGLTRLETGVGTWRGPAGGAVVPPTAQGGMAGYPPPNPSAMVQPTPTVLGPPNPAVFAPPNAGTVQDGIPGTVVETANAQPMRTVKGTVIGPAGGFAAPGGVAAGGVVTQPGAPKKLPPRTLAMIATGAAAVIIIVLVVVLWPSPPSSRGVSSTSFTSSGGGGGGGGGTTAPTFTPPETVPSNPTTLPPGTLGPIAPPPSKPVQPGPTKPQGETNPPHQTPGQPQQTPAVPAQPQQQPVQPTRPAGPQSFLVRHRHFYKERMQVTYCGGPLLVYPDGTVTYHCAAADPMGRCDNVNFSRGDIRELEIKSHGGELHIGTTDGQNWDFFDMNVAGTVQHAYHAIKPFVP